MSVSLLFVVLLIVVFVSPSLAQTNYILNGGFESGLDSWNVTNPSNIYLAVESTDSHIAVVDGSHALAVGINPPSDTPQQYSSLSSTDYAEISQTVSSVPADGSVYDFCFDVSALTWAIGEQDARFSIYLGWDGDKNLVTQNQLNSSPSINAYWHACTTLVTSTTVNTQSFTAWFHIESATATYYLIDNVSLTQHN